MQRLDPSVTVPTPFVAGDATGTTWRRVSQGAEGCPVDDSRSTVHQRSEKWIDARLAYLRRHLKEQDRVVANLESVPGATRTQIRSRDTGRGKATGKLNLLAAEIVAEVLHDG